MFLDVELQSDFAVLQPVGNKANDFFLTTSQERDSVGVVKLNGIRMSQSIDKMLGIFVTRPDLPPMDRLDAFRKGFQGMAPIENTTRAVTKSVNHTLGFGTLQEHDYRCAIGGAYLLKDLVARLRAVQKVFADHRDVGLVRSQVADDLLRTSSERSNGEFLSAVSEHILQQLTRHVIRRDDEDTNAIFWPPNRLGHPTASNLLEWAVRLARNGFRIADCGIRRRCISQNAATKENAGLIAIKVYAHVAKSVFMGLNVRGADPRFHRSILIGRRSSPPLRVNLAVLNRNGMKDGA